MNLSDIEVDVMNVTRDKGACSAPEVVQQSMLERLVNHVFAGQRRPLFTHLLRDEELSAEVVAYVERLLRQRKGKARND